ncbi:MULTISPECIES: hypothetical protein [Flavobacterium]|uniref:DUF4251 domain-containing protein n=1 Tax=Flavobacterium hankyongi TaxID=1176532 RepID=A0ABP9A0T0_9FLAO|nr:hypothetical protein [Flavobacterium sp. N1846]
MKKILQLILLLLTGMAIAQSGDPKVDALLQQLKEQQKAPGKITFKMKGKTYTEIGSFMEDTKKRFVISSHLTLDSTPDSSISFVIPSKKSGSYSIEDKKSGVLVINGKVYQIRGNITVNISGKKISGSFIGELFEIPNNKAKASDQTSGVIQGNFQN